MDNIARAPRLILILKSDVKIAHQAGYALYGGRWHKIHQHKPAPKGAPVAAHPTAAGVHAPVKHFTDDQWAQLQLPDSNVNAPSYNKKLKQLQEWSDAGDVTAIVGSNYGVNTYSKKLATIANTLLGLHGSPHKVAAGQGAGWHSAVEHPVAPVAAAPQEAPQVAAPAPQVAAVPAASEEQQTVDELVAAGNWGMLDKLATSSTNSKTKAYAALALSNKPADLAPAAAPTAAPAPEPAALAGKVTADIEFPDFPDHYKASPFYKKVAYSLADLADKGDLEGLKMANDGSSAWHGASPNSEKLLAYYGALMEKVSGHQAKWNFDESSPDMDGAPTLMLYAADGHSFFIAKNEDGYQAGHIDADGAPQDYENVQSAAAGAAYLKPMLAKKGIKPLTTADLEHFDKLAPAKPPRAPKPAPVVSAEHQVMMNKWAANGNTSALQDVVDDQKDNQPHLAAYAQAKLDELNAPPPPAGNTLLAQIPWDKQFLPESNSNASSHNKAVTKIKALAEAGDESGLAAIVSAKSGAKQTYAKKQGLLAQAALAALKEGGTASPAPEPAPSAKPATDLTEVAAWKHVMDAVNSGGKPKDAADAWFTANPVGGKELNEVLSSLGYGYLANYQTTPHKPLSPTPTGVPAYDYLAQSLSAGGFATHAAVKWLAANPGSKKELDDALSDHGYGHLVTHAGPKEGDTKPAADGGTLVFKDGHWHLQEVATPAPAATVKEVAAAKTTLFNTTAGHSKQWSYYVAPNAAGGWDFVTEYGKIGGAQQKTVKPFSSQTGAHSAAQLAAKAKLKNGYGGEKTDWMHKVKVGGAAPAAAPAQAAQAPAAAKPAAPTPNYPSMDDWAQTGPQGGSNPGGKFKSPNGVEWYCKFPESEDIAKSEVLAAKLYAAAGLVGQDAQLVTKDGKVGIASRWVDVKKAKTPAALAMTKDACGGFAVDAWLGNWDVVGLGYDNLQIGADGKAVRVDAGGSLEYRAQGSKKEFGPHVVEIETLRDAVKNPQTASIFGKMTQADISASVAKVAAVSDADIWNLVQQFGPGDYNAKKALSATLIARKADLLAKYPKAAKAVAKSGASGTSWVRLKPGETIVETGEKFGIAWAKIRVPAKGFQASSIPTPPNFFMNGSQGATGTWKSSVKHVNEANNEAGQTVYNAAMAHKKPGPVEGLTFAQIDKATGQQTGVQLPFAQHPAGEIKEYFKQVTSELEAQTKSTYKTVQNGSFTQSYSKAAMSLAAEFSPKNYDQFKAHAAKAADYLVLSKSAAAGLPVPDVGIFEEQWEDVSPKLKAFKGQCKTTYAGLTPSEQAACKSYTGSSYANWNQALRAGDTSSSHYQSAQAMIKGMKKAAIDIPEGTILWRGIGVGEDTYKSVAGAIIQDGSFQSSSFGSSPAFSSYKTWLKIHVGKGVKGVHATIFSNFGSGEREIIIKNNVRYAVLSVTKHDNFIDSKGNSHGPKTIVDLLALPHED